ncbi:hypothetical protein GTW25_19765 [Aliihoeflea aestuarii]|jgi:hypothetical protein|uniref:hypothetical protein n=1 Tax=Aliihoeflea aestuarii TaxID=453840 RepID=UPI00209600A0|nr:hypothetical protein [Aliihoeflea aestuarii]MCO6393260.1 hypothetical protein [Aliihoeflea aestuarii]
MVEKVRLATKWIGIDAGIDDRFRRDGWKLGPSPADLPPSRILVKRFYRAPRRTDLPGLLIVIMLMAIVIGMFAVTPAIMPARHEDVL